MIRYGRVSGHTNLVGSELVHNHFIHVELKEARRRRSLHEDRFYSGKMIAEIYLREQQLAIFIASGNTEGVPCTIRRRSDVGGKLVDVEDIEEENKHALA